MLPVSPHNDHSWAEPGRQPGVTTGTAVGRGSESVEGERYDESYVARPPTPPPSTTRPHPFTSRRLQQFWVAVKRFSPKHRSRNLSIAGEENGGPDRVNWSPFARRKADKSRQYRLYSSHPDISCSQLNECLDEPPAPLRPEVKGDCGDSRSPMSRIRKIKRDMQRCVQKATSSDSELGKSKSNSSLDVRKAGPGEEEAVPVGVPPPVPHLAIVERAPLDCASRTRPQSVPARRSITVQHSTTSAEDEMNHSVHSLGTAYSSNHSSPSAEVSSLPKAGPRPDDEELRIATLLQHPFFQLDIHLRNAHNLVAKDACGTSDPYVKFKVGRQIVFKSRTISKSLNPNWDEYLVLPVEDIFEPILLKVYDHNYLFLDDYIGTAHIDVTKLEPGVPTDLELPLHDIDHGSDFGRDNCGKVFLAVKLNAKTQEEKEHFYGRSGSKWISGSSAEGGVSTRRVKSQPWDSIVYVLLIKGSNIYAESDYCVKFRLASEKFRSKSVSRSVHSPAWNELFDMHLYTDQSKVLEIYLSCSNQSEPVCKTCVDLNELASEKAHHLVVRFDSNCCVQLMLTITGTVSTSGDGSLQDYPDIATHYSITRSLRDMTDIGHLFVKVYKAEHLAAADINGKSDPFCVLELVNERLQTSTEYKTLSPEWNKMFTFKIKDMFEVLEITIYDEDRDRVEFLGKVAIPLIQIKNGEKRWYALKDKKLRHRVKGHILLEFWIAFNNFKASVRTFTPKEERHMRPEVKFKRSLFVKNAMRLKSIGMEMLEWAQFVQSCVQWESPARSLLAFLTFLTFVYYFELYMFPLLLLLVILKNWLWLRIGAYFQAHSREDELDYIDESVFEDEDDDKTEEKKSLKERLQIVQEISCSVMVTIGQIASYIERVKNAANFSVPFLTWLAAISLALATIVMYYVPVRYLILAWGVNKFTKKFRAPNAINNNEVMDFLSRVPDIDEKVMYREYKPRVSSENREPSKWSPQHSATSQARFDQISLASVDVVEGRRFRKRK